MSKREAFKVLFDFGFSSSFFLMLGRFSKFHAISWPNLPKHQIPFVGAGDA